MKTTNAQSQQAEATKAKTAKTATKQAEPAKTATTAETAEKLAKTAKPANKMAVRSKMADYIFQSSSAYGVTVEVLCMMPDASKEEILNAVTDAGIDVKAHKNAVQTGISQAKKVIELLRSNDMMK